MRNWGHRFAGAGMIQILFECGADAPIAFQHDAVMGVRVACRERVFQVAEGPESAVMLAFAVLAEDGAHLARTKLVSRTLSDWRTETVQLDDLPVGTALQVRAFAQATAICVAPDARQAIGFLSGLIEAQQTPAIASGHRLISKVGGQSGTRAWVAV